MKKRFRLSILLLLLCLFIINIISNGTDANYDTRNSSSQSELTKNDIQNMTVVWDDATAHTKNIWMVRFSPDGLRLVTVGFDGKIILWNLSSSEIIWDEPGHTSYIRAVAWSPDGRRFVTGSENGIIRIWNSSTGKKENQLNDALLAGKIAHNGPVVGLSWSPDGSKIASVSGEDSEPIKNGDNYIKVWDAVQGVKLYDLTKFKYQAMDVVFSPQQPNLLGVAGDNELRIYNSTSKERIRTFKTNGTAHCISWSPDGTFVGTGTRNFTIEIYNINSGVREGYYLDTDFKRRELAWSPDSRFIAEAGSAENIKVRSVKNGTMIKTLYGPSNYLTLETNQLRCAGNYLPSLDWSSDGKYIATGTAGIYTVVVFGDKKYDRIPPELTGFGPTGTSVSRVAVISMKFSEPVNLSSLKAGFSYTDGINTWDENDGYFSSLGREILYYPSERFPSNSSIFVTIETSITDDAGNGLTGKNSWSFRTAKNYPPVLSTSFVQPKSGDDETDFSFITHYLDLDGDPPAEIDVVIDGLLFQMTHHNGTEDNGYYQYRSTLSAGSHSYYFTASDGETSAIGSSVGSQHSSTLKVEKSEDAYGINPHTTDIVGGIIVLILIVVWFKIVIRKSEKKE